MPIRFQLTVWRKLLTCFVLACGIITCMQAQTAQSYITLKSNKGLEPAAFRLGYNMPQICSFSPEPFLHTRLSKQFIIHGLRSGIALPFRPLQWQPKQWATAGSVAASLVLAYRFDKELFEYVNQNLPTVDNRLHRYLFSPAGNGLLAAPVVAGMYIFGDERARGTALASAQSWGYGLAASTLLKYAFQRHRPESNVQINPRQWDGPLGGFNHNSFPSRHATLAFSLLTVIATEYRDKPWIPVLCYSVAAIASLSRVSIHHWPSDVIAGAALGFGIGKFVHRISKREDDRQLKK